MICGAAKVWRMTDKTFYANLPFKHQKNLLKQPRIMKEKFIISTTNNIENGIIQQYINVVCTNIVIGTNIFSDFAASLTDLFGGRSDSYKRKLEKIYQEAKKELQAKAARMGANAIIGFQVDFDEISGKDKSMFMVSASGTACKIEYHAPQETVHQPDIISQTDLDNEVKRRSIIQWIKEGYDLNEDWAQFLIENPQTEIIQNLALLYVESENRYKEDLSKMIVSVLRAYPRQEVIPILYHLYEINKDDNKDKFFKLLNNCNLFDASTIQEICSRDLHGGVRLLSLKSEYYDAKEISTMNQLCNFFETLPDTGKIESVTTGVFNKKEQEKFICENGHKNDIEKSFCSTCGLNIKGINQKEVNYIKEFKERVEILNMLSRKNIPSSNEAQN